MCRGRRNYAIFLNRLHTRTCKYACLRPNEQWAYTYCGSLFSKCLAPNSTPLHKLSLVWMNDASSYVMVLKIIKLIHGQVAGQLTACVIASLCLPPWAVLLLGGECVARWAPTGAPPRLMDSEGHWPRFLITNEGPSWRKQLWKWE